MLKYFGASSCPRCNTALVHEPEESNNAASGESEQDQRWLCPNCGYSRPMVYAVVRPDKGLGKK